MNNDITQKKIKSLYEIGNSYGLSTELVDYHEDLECKNVISLFFFKQSKI